jgi:lipoxygenase
MLDKIMQEWPLRSKLDPNIYGPMESAITDEIIKEDFITHF